MSTDGIGPIMKPSHDPADDDIDGSHTTYAHPTDENTPQEVTPVDIYANLLDLNPIDGDDILTRLQLDLGDIDGQLKDLEQEAYDKKQKSNELRMFQNVVHSLSQQDGGFNTANDYENTGKGPQALHDIDEALTQIKDPKLVAELQGLRTAISNGGSNDGHIDATAIQQKLDYAKNELDSLNSDNELMMMRIDRLMKLRNEAITTASTEEAGLHDTVKAVISNMRV